MLRNLFVAAPIVALMGSMPAFASAGVDAKPIPNEVIPMTMSPDGVSCPQLDFSHKIVEKTLSMTMVSEDFTASINSIIWDAKADNSGALGNFGGSKDKTKKKIKFMATYPKGGCKYSIHQDGQYMILFMNIKPSVDESRKAEHIKRVRDIVERIKAAGVVSYDDLMNIINEVMPKPR